MSEAHSSAPSPLEIHPDEWVEIVDDVRTLPFITPYYLQYTRGYDEEASKALFEELKAQSIISSKPQSIKPKEEGRIPDSERKYNVLEPEQFRQAKLNEQAQRYTKTQAAAGKVAVESVSELSTRERRKIGLEKVLREAAVGSVTEKTRQERKRTKNNLRHTRNPYSWEELGEPSLPEPDSLKFISLNESADRLPVGITIITHRLLHAQRQEEGRKGGRDSGPTKLMDKVVGDDSLETDTVPIKIVSSESGSATADTTLENESEKFDYSADPVFAELFNLEKLRQLEKRIALAIRNEDKLRMHEINTKRRARGEKDIVSLDKTETDAIHSRVSDRITSEYLGELDDPELREQLTVARLEAFHGLKKEE